MKRATLTCLLAAFAALGLAPAAFAAGTSHPYLPSLSHEGFSAACGDAVDSHGDLYVADYAGQIDVYAPSGSLLTTIEQSGAQPCGLAVDSSGALYVNHWQGKVVKLLPSSYPPDGSTTWSPDTSLGPEGVLAEGTNYAVAVDPANDHVYVSAGDHIVSYSSAGAALDEAIGSGVSGALYYGLDVYGKTGAVYAGDGNSSKLYVFSATAPAGPPQTTIDGSETPQGSFGFGSYGAGLAVDQANGHVFLFDAAHLALDEFEASGAYVGQTEHSFADGEPTDVATAPPASPLAGDVFVADLGKVDALGGLTYGEPPIPLTGEASGVGLDSVTVEGSVNPLGAPVSGCKLEYVTAAAFLQSSFATATSAPCEPDAAALGSGSEPVRVKATLTGLAEGTEYRYRLTATNEAGTAHGEALAFTTLQLPQLSAIEAVPGTTTATLKAKIDPNGPDTRYRFEYGPDSGYGSAAPVPDGDAGQGAEPHRVSVQLTGLVPGTTYHYRLLATSSSGAAESADLTFTTTAPGAADSCPNAAIRALQHAAYLPDCRAYEMVSIAEKNDNNVFAPTVPAAAGDRIAYLVLGGFPGSTSGGKVPLLARRTSSGWISESLVDPARPLLSPSYAVAAETADLSEFLLGSFEGFQAPPAMYLVRRHADGSESLLHTFPREHGGFPSLMASADLAHALTLLPEDEEATEGTLQLYDTASEPRLLLSRMPGSDEPPSCGVNGLNGFVSPGRGLRSQHWLAEDGSAAFFLSAGDSANCEQAPLDLYRRDLGAEATQRLSGPALPGDPELGANRFIAAAPDGSWAIYRTATSLDPADDADGSNTDMDLYRWSESGGNVCLTCVVPHVDALSGSQASIASQDGSYVYFNSDRAYLGAPATVEGESNLYLWHDGTIRFVAQGTPLGGAWVNGTELTPNGKVLIFVSDGEYLNSATGRDNGGFKQLYRYDAESGALDCLSCPAEGAAKAPVHATLGPNTASTTIASFHSISEDGSTVFFVTAEPLLRGDVNEAPDIYEWHDGKLGLITDGTAAHNPYFVGTTANGHDAFFVETGRLTASALDGSQKLYDARAGGGFEEGGAATPGCEGEACRGTAAPAPESLQPATRATEVGGNVRARRHRRGRHHHRRRHSAHPHRSGRTSR